MCVEQSEFLAIWKRASNIHRWPLFTNLTKNTDASHSFEVAIISHLIGTIEREIFKKNTDPSVLASMALFHESSEVAGLSDIPTPSKRINNDVYSEIKKIERFFEQILLDTLPDELKISYQNLIIQDNQDRYYQLLKASDDIAAYLEAERELKLSNFQYFSAVMNGKNKLEYWREKFDSVAWFLDRFIEPVNRAS